MTLKQTVERMEAVMKQHWSIAVSAAILLAAISMLSVYQHKTNERIFLSYFQEHQLLHAQHVADQIGTLLSGHRHILQALPSLSSDLTDDMEHLKTDIRTYSDHMGEDYIEEISLCDKKGAILYSTDSHAIGSSEDQKPFFLWAQKKANRGRWFISPLISNEEMRQTQIRPGPSGAEHSSPDFIVLLAIPIYRRPRSDWEFAGALSFLIDLKKFLAKELRDYKMSAHQLWIMDRDGRLLFHSEHPEMVLRNIRQQEETCLQCHASFDHVKHILEKGEGTLDYQVKDSPKKLAAFARLDFGDTSWVVLISSTYDSVAALSRRSLKESLLLLGTVVLFFLLGSAYLIYNDRTRVRAVEELKHWQELTAERKKSEDSLKRSEEQLRYLSSKLLTTQEDERGRISKDLHDGLGGALATLKLRENLLKGGLM